MQNKKGSAKASDRRRSARKQSAIVRSPAPLKVGLTGNIGSGKSTAAEAFSKLGVPTFDTDKIGHELLEGDPDIRKRIEEAFGNQVFSDDLIDRRKLAQVVFASSEKKRKLESILHPAIMSTVNERLRSCSDRSYAIIEVPLLYEAKLSGEFEYVILVKSEEKNAVERASLKLGISKEAVQKRLETQIAQSEKEKLADFVIANDGTREDLRNRVELLHAIISSLGKEAFQKD